MRLNPFQKSTPAQILAERYHLLGKIGTNGARQTFVAQDLRVSGRPRCIVQQFNLWAEAGSVKDIKALFEAQSQALETLGAYDFVPELLNSFQQDGQFYWVHAFVEGDKLSQELISLTSWSDERVIKLLSELLSALSVIHQQGSLHLDLKPSNLIRSYESNHLTLVNFGAMQQLGAQIVKPLPSIRIPPLFSISSYMPSEQIAGHPKPASDIYAVGIMAVQALTGHPVATVLENIQAGDLYRNSFASLRHPALLALLERMVQYDYRDRHATATEVLADIKRLPPELSQYAQAIAPKPSPSHAASHTAVAEQAISSPDSSTDIPAEPLAEDLAEPLPQTLPIPVASGLSDTHSSNRKVSQQSSGARSDSNSGRASADRKVLLPVGVGAAAIALLGMGSLVWRTTNIDAAIQSVNNNSKNSVSQERQLLSSGLEGSELEGSNLEGSDIEGNSPTEQQAREGRSSSEESSSLPSEGSVASEQFASEESFIAPTTPASRSLPQEGDVVSSSGQYFSEQSSEQSSAFVGDSYSSGRSATESTAPISTQAAKATVSRFYDYVAESAWNPARTLLNDKLARSLEPNFFYQFEEVSVENVRVMDQTDESVDLMVQNTYVYPDGTYQQENRNYTVAMIDNQPTIVDTDFVEVIRDRR